MDDDTSKVDMQNVDERDVLNTLKNHASKSLEADLLESLVGAGMSQACYNLCVVCKLSGWEVFVLQVAYVAARKLETL